MVGTDLHEGVGELAKLLEFTQFLLADIASTDTGDGCPAWPHDHAEQAIGIDAAGAKDEREDANEQDRRHPKALILLKAAEKIERHTLPRVRLSQLGRIR